MKQIRKRLTYANVMSSIAVFLILGGATAFAASKIGSNEIKANAITSGKIKKEAVTTKKIKKNAVTGKQVKESSLGTVPSASLANSIPPAEATHLVGASGEPPFENGSSNVPPEGPFGFNPVGFYKDHEGIVHLQGIAKVGPEGIVFTLPPGYRPASGKLLELEPINELFTLIAGSNVSVPGFDLSGKVLGSGGKAVVLDSITFRAES